MTDAIAEVLRRRGVARVAQAHADHFEPFARRADGAVIALDDVETWLDATEKTARGRSASLFYRQSSFTPGAREHRDALWSDARLGFVPEGRYDLDTRVIERLIARGRDLHVHVHHESWTGCTTSGFAPESAADAERLAAFLRLVLGRLRAFDLPMRRWGFVHGCWALQGSDAEVCNVSDELRVLVEAGCVADFSFPAGRTWCNPATQRAPYTVVPVDRAKGYDTPQADPRPLSAPGARAIAPGRFLVWTCEQSYEDVSLDRLSTHPRDPNVVALAWATKGWVYGDTLWVKTHAHSLAPVYWPSAGHGRTHTPLASAGVTAVFDRLRRACDAAHVPLDHITVTELLARLGAIDEGDYGG